MEPVSPLKVKKYSRFRVFTTPYKAIKNHKITVDVLIPKMRPRGKCPLLVKIHGGLLVAGSSSFLGWFAPWIFDFALHHAAIIIAPNYRLLPEATGLDVLEDMNDFFNWIYSDLGSFVSRYVPGVEVDFDKLLVHGDCGGAYLAILSAFHQAPDRIRAVISAYPFLDFDDPWYHSSFPKPILGLPQQPADLVRNHLATLVPDTIISGAYSPARMQLMAAITQHGLFDEFIGTDVRLYPMWMLDQELKGPEDLPRIFIFHGRQDSAVPYGGTVKFVNNLRTFEGGEEKVFMKIEDGEHGFDNADDVTLDTPWLKEGLEFVTPTWLA